MVLDELARELFGFLCHQDPARTWEPGGVGLAMCARCVGVYAGFALAVPMLGLARRVGGKAGLWLHGILVVQVAVFGFHLVSHGPMVRTLSGQMFAVGVLYFLCRAVRRAESRPGETTGWWCALALMKPWCVRRENLGCWGATTWRTPWQHAR